MPALGRIGDPDDILASVLVEDGKVRWLDCCGLAFCSDTARLDTPRNLSTHACVPPLHSGRDNKIDTRTCYQASVILKQSGHEFARLEYIRA